MLWCGKVLCDLQVMPETPVVKLSSETVRAVRPKFGLLPFVGPEPPCTFSGRPSTTSWPVSTLELCHRSKVSVSPRRRMADPPVDQTFGIEQLIFRHSAKKASHNRNKIAAGKDAGRPAQDQLWNGPQSISSVLPREPRCQCVPLARLTRRSKKARTVPSLSTENIYDMCPTQLCHTRFRLFP